MSFINGLINVTSAYKLLAYIGSKDFLLKNIASIRDHLLDILVTVNVTIILKRILQSTVLFSFIELYFDWNENYQPERKKEKKQQTRHKLN